MSNQLAIVNEIKFQLVNLKEASEWASEYIHKKVTISNLSYLIQYGRIKKYGDNGDRTINKIELKEYYDSIKLDQDNHNMGNDVNWDLSFVEYKESERTKHVHRLHPYKGKFIPQLVEYFLDSHIDKHKTEIFFHKGDIVLDPFCGSGTTLVQANELGMQAVGIDISQFNAMISNVKISKHDLIKLDFELRKLTRDLIGFQKTHNNVDFENELLTELSKFNNAYFPSPEYKIRARKNEIDEKKYSEEKEKEFLGIFNKLIQKYDLKILQDLNGSFLNKWYLDPVKKEIDYLFSEIKEIQDQDLKKVIAVILSRTIRSCRATTHADLGTLIDPVTTTYYCKKHGKVCKPIFSTLSWWETYCKDTIERLRSFNQVRTETYQYCISGDSRTINIVEALNNEPELAKILAEIKIKGIFSSPPYVGLIDYHEQHAYAYELFGFDRNDEFEIGPLYKGQGQVAKNSYVDGIATVLINCKKYLQKDYNVFLVANDKYNLYPRIAELAGMKIVNQYKRPVLNRVEKDRSSYTESIFLMREK